MHTVIVGGGFAGVKAALELSKRHIGKVTLISDKPYFLHHATLYATATGKNSAESVIPLEVIFANHPSVDVVQDTIISFDPRRHLVSSKKRSYHYTKLVIALGSVTTYFGIPGMDKYSFGIKTLEDVRNFQDHLHEDIVQKKLDKEVFVIGGGQTGVELAGALQSYLRTLKTMYRLKNTGSRVTLVEGSDRLVPRMSKTASRKIEAQLRELGVRVITGRTVNKLGPQTLTIEGRDCSTETALWTSGVANHPFFEANHVHFHLAPNGRVNVNKYLEALDDVYVIGDNNTVAYSGTALPAMRQATHVAKNIARVAGRRPQAKFRPHSAPSGVPVGESWAYIEWLGIYASGGSGRILRRLLELYGYCQLLPVSTARAVWRTHDVHHVSW